MNCNKYINGLKCITPLLFCKIASSTLRYHLIHNIYPPQNRLHLRMTHNTLNVVSMTIQKGGSHSSVPKGVKLKGKKKQARDLLHSVL